MNLNQLHKDLVKAAKREFARVMAGAQPKVENDAAQVRKAAAEEKRQRKRERNVDLVREAAIRAERR